MKTDIQQHQRPQTQSEEVLHHLKFRGTIDSMTAIKDYKITRLASVIHNLRREGWNIKSVDVPFVNKYGRKGNFSQYYLIRYE